MKFIFYNDVQYLLKKRFWLFAIIFFTPLIMFVTNLGADISVLEIINSTMGTMVSFTNLRVTELLMYLLMVCFYTFLVADIYVKDICYQLDNIFLRMNPNIWYLKKTILFIIIVFIIKVIQYLPVYFILGLFGNNVFDLNILWLFLIDFSYIIFIQFSFLFIYMFSVLFKRGKILSLLLLIIFIVLIPKNIWSLKDKILYIIFFILLIQFLVYKLFQKYNKKVIESI